MISVQKKLLLAIPLLILLAALPIGAAASTVNIHVDARYENASYTTTLPSPTPTPTAMATAAASTQPSPTTNTASPNPSTADTENPSTATPSPGQSATANPQVPEFTPLALLLIAAAATLSAAALRGKKASKRSALAAALLLLACLIPASSWAQTSTPTPSTPNTQFSLYFTNGTAYPTGALNAAGYQNGGMYLNVGGIQATASSYGSQFTPLTNVVVLKNVGDANITVNASIRNVNCPANITIQLTVFPMSPSAYAPYSNNWLGNASAVSKNPVAPGQYMYLGLQVVLSQPANVPSGTTTFGFSYSFDIEVNAAAGG